MAFEEDIECKSFKSNADLSAATNQYRLVKMVGDNTIDLCAATTDKPIGVLQNKPVAGQAATVATLGKTKCQAGSGVTAGQNIGTTAAGRAQTAATGQFGLGYAVTGTSNSGELFVLNITPTYIAP